MESLLIRLQLIKIGMMLLKSIARLSISPTLSLASMRPFFFSTSGSSSEPPPKTFETASMTLSKTSSVVSSDQKATTSPTSSKKKLSQQAQSAIWAERVIHFILNAKPLTDIHSHSLREQILRLQNPDSLHYFEAEPKEKIMRLFTSGVPLDSLVFNQDRVKSAKQAFIQDQIEENNFIFCPNLLVTKQIFKTMMVFSSNFLLTGGFGISKTVSIILFIQLSNHVSSYFFKAAQPQHKETKEELLYLKSVQVNPFFFDQDIQDKQLERQTLLLKASINSYFSRPISRYWYWSIDLQQHTNQLKVKDMFLLQASQLSEEKKAQLRSLTSFKQFIDQLQRCYPDQSLYPMKLVVDQINTLVALMRIWNALQDKYLATPEQKRDEQQFKKDKTNLRDKATDIKLYLLCALNLSNKTGGQYILNSSMSIENQLLNFRTQNNNIESLEIQNKHQDLKILQISYLQGLEKGCIDFLHNFWFQIERKLKILEINQETIDEMRRLFLEEVKEKKANYFSRFLFLRQYLTLGKVEMLKIKYIEAKERQKQDLANYNRQLLLLKTQQEQEKLQKPNKLENPFKRIYQSFTEENIIKYRQKIKQYFEKDQQVLTTASIFFAIYDLAVAQKFSKDKDKPITVTIQQLRKKIFTQLNPLLLLNENTYKEVLPFSYNERQNSIKFYWTPGQFIQASRDFIFGITNKEVFDPHLLLSLEQYCSHRGIFFEHCVIQSLKKGADVTFHQPLQKLKELSFIISQNRSTRFHSFNQSYQNNHEYVITPKSLVKLDKRLNKKNKLKSQQAIAYIKKFNKGKPKNEKYTGDLEMYRVHRVATASIGKNLKDLFTKCDQNPNEYCIAIPHHRQNFDPRSECIDFIIAKKQLLTYHIFTFDVSISRQASKLSTAKNFFAQLFQRQKYNGNCFINHVILCHKDAVRQVSYDPKGIFNIICSPWDETTFKESKNPLALNAFYRMRGINNMMNDTEE